MTPPDTNLRTERRRHRPALYAIAFAVLFALLTLILRGLFATDPETTPLADPGIRTPVNGEQETSSPNPPREPAEN
jgi:hypothetical protein